MAFTYFTDAASGADTNGGSSEGAAKATGAAATTNGTATVQLDGGSNLSTVAVGDTIRIAARADGIRSTNIYEILAVDDGLDQVTVNPAPAAAAGQAWAIGGAWATLGKAEDVVQAGDTVNAKGGTDYAETLTFAAASVGGSGTPILWRGYTSTVGDGGMATINGGGVRATCVTATSPTSMHTVFRNFRFTNSTGTAWLGDSGTLAVKFKKCRFDNAGGAGVIVGASCGFEGCYFHDNDDEGMTCLAFVFCTGCIAADNGLEGFSTQGGVFHKCIATGNGSSGFLSVLTSSHFCLDCTVDGENVAGDAYNLAASSVGATNIAAINCIAYDCGDGFIGPAGWLEKLFSRNNLLHSNTDNYDDFQTFDGEVLADPLFVNEAAQDYGLQGASPAKNVGFGPGTNGWISQTGDNPDIGAGSELNSSSGGGGANSIKTGGAM